MVSSHQSAMGEKKYRYTKKIGHAKGSGNRLLILVRTRGKALSYD